MVLFQANLTKPNTGNIQTKSKIKPFLYERSEFGEAKMPKAYFAKQN
jgi:hypothetical protein